MVTVSWSTQVPHTVRHLYCSRLDHSSLLPVTHVLKFISLVTCILPFIYFIFFGGGPSLAFGFDAKLMSNSCLLSVTLVSYCL